LERTNFRGQQLTAALQLLIGHGGRLSQRSPADDLSVLTYVIKRQSREILRACLTVLPREQAKTCLMDAMLACVGGDRLEGKTHSLAMLDLINYVFADNGDPELLRQLRAFAASTSVRFFSGLTVEPGAKQTSSRQQRFIHGMLRALVEFEGTISFRECNLNDIVAAKLVLVPGLNAVIDFSDNPMVTMLPLALGKMPVAGGITKSLRFDFRGCNLEGIDLQLAQLGDPVAIVNHCKTILRGDNIPIREIKLVVVGGSGAGKTTLLQRLQKDKFKPDLLSTDGVDMNTFSLGNITFRTFVCHLCCFFFSSSFSLSSLLSFSTLLYSTLLSLHGRRVITDGTFFF
jgi:hypothetical protein